MRTLATLFVLISLSAFAQNWALLNPAYKYNYSNDGSDTISNQIFVTHIDTLGVDSFRYELNRIGVVCDTCPASLGGPCDGCFVWVDQPQALQRSVFVSDGAWLFVDPDTFLVLTDAPVDSLWSFHPDGSLLASMGPPVAAVIFGVPDSIRTIAISNGDSLLLSQAFGLLRISALVLVGVEGAEVGVLFPKPLDFFDFQVGDVVNYIINEVNGTQFPPEVDWIQYRHMLITSRTELVDGYTYGYDLDIDYSGGLGLQLPLWMDPGLTGSWTMTEPMLYTHHRMLFSYPGEVVGTTCFGTTEPDQSWGSMLAKWGINADGDWWVANGTLAEDLCGNGGAPLILPYEIQPGLHTMDYCASAHYEEGVGPTRLDISGSGHSCYLTGSSGHVGIDDHSGNARLRLFPNPTSDHLMLLGPTPSGGSWRMQAMTGQLLQMGFIRQGAPLVINVSSLPEGMYLLTVTTAQGNSSQRFVIAR